MNQKPDHKKVYFLVTSRGLAATRWLAYALGMHPNVFVCHGSHPIRGLNEKMCRMERNSRTDGRSYSEGVALKSYYQDTPLKDIFAAYVKKCPNANAVGNVHTFTYQELLVKRDHGKSLPPLQVVNLVRHPVTYIDSHVALVKKTKKLNTDTYLYYLKMYDQALALFSSLGRFRVNDKEWIPFIISCFSVVNMMHDFVHTGVRHIQMEKLTSDVRELESVCTYLTKQSYGAVDLAGLYRDGPINSHRLEGAIKNPMRLYKSWPSWKKCIVRIMFSQDLIRKFCHLGYDVSMIHPLDMGQLSEGIRDLERDVKEVFGADISLSELETLYDGEPRLITQGYRGFNLVRFCRKYYGVSQELGNIDLRTADLSEAGRNGKCFVANSLSKIQVLIDRSARLKQPRRTIST